MQTLAMLMLDGPGVPYLQLEISVYLPTAVVASSWFLIRWKRRLVIPALIIALLSAFVVLGQVLDSMARWAMLNDFGWSYVFAIYLSAAFPFLAIAVFYFDQKTRPNKASEPTAINPPPSATPPAPLAHF